MVRLLPIGFSFSCKGLIQFQSHNGAIAAEKGRSVVSTRAVVSIPQWCDCCDPKVGAALRKLFQSHNGAIAAWRYVLAIVAMCVSIPQWCDCCIKSLPGKWTPIPVSIPQWCDCCKCLARKPSSLRDSFNPTMVRLLQRNTKIAPDAQNRFNPTMVRLLQ